MHGKEYPSSHSELMKNNWKEQGQRQKKRGISNISGGQVKLSFDSGREIESGMVGYFDIGEMPQLKKLTH